MEKPREQNLTRPSPAASAPRYTPDGGAVSHLTTMALVLSIPAVHTAVGIMISGPLTRHMLSHIVLMNVLAPIAAYLLTLCKTCALVSDRSFLVCSTILQIVLLWAWHTPPLLSEALGSHTFGLLSGVSLTLAATWFWASLFCVRGQLIWRAIAALLITGKFFCLLGALLVFAPRALFECFGAACAQPGLIELSDQQFAGLLMIIACPLTYVTAGVIAAARWLSELSRRTQSRTVAFGLPLGSEGATVQW